MSAYVLMVRFKFLFEFLDRKGKMGMMFSCMVLLLSKKKVLQLFSVTEGKR